MGGFGGRNGFSWLIAVISIGFYGVFKGSHFERDVIVGGALWYAAYLRSDRQIEEMMGERGEEVEHSALHRWVRSEVPALKQALPRINDDDAEEEIRAFRVVVGIAVGMVVD